MSEFQPWVVLSSQDKSGTKPLAPHSDAAQVLRCCFLAKRLHKRATLNRDVGSARLRTSKEEARKPMEEIEPAKIPSTSVRIPAPSLIRNRKRGGTPTVLLVFIVLTAMLLVLEARRDMPRPATLRTLLGPRLEQNRWNSAAITMASARETARPRACRADQLRRLARCCGRAHSCWHETSETRNPDTGADALLCGSWDVHVSQSATSSEQKQLSSSYRRSRLESGIGAPVPQTPRLQLA